MERRILCYFMDLLIILMLYCESGQTSGYDIIKYLHQKHGFLYSPGTVYSCLCDLERRGLVKGKQNGRKRVYILTEHGKK
ncbi:MAG: PadR family transcriptional regulator, partial [Candidatus Bathyarchaeia archaeon]